MSNGNNSNLAYNRFKYNESTTVAIPQGSVVRKVILHGDQDTETKGIAFYDAQGKVLLEAG